jgi:excisionase family DNA binding protein
MPRKYSAGPRAVQPDGPDKLLRSVDVCQLLNISGKTLQRLIARKPPAITFIKAGPRTFRFRRSAIDGYIAAHEIRGAA